MTYVDVVEASQRTQLVTSSQVPILAEGTISSIISSVTGLLISPEIAPILSTSCNDNSTSVRDCDVADPTGA